MSLGSSMLNRQNRRALEKNGGVTPSVLADYDKRIRREFEAETYKIISDTVEKYSLALAMTLHDTLGFGHDRTRKVLDRVDKLCREMIEGRLSMEDVKKTVEADIGLTIK